MRAGGPISDEGRIEEDAIEFAHGYLVGWDDCNRGRKSMTPEAAQIEELREEIDRALEGSDKYPWAASEEERRRAFIFELLAVWDLDTKLMIEKLDAFEGWLRDGKPRPGLTVV